MSDTPKSATGLGRIADPLAEDWRTTVVDMAKGPHGRAVVTHQSSLRDPGVERWLVGQRAFASLDDARAYAARLVGTWISKPSRPSRTGDTASVPTS